MTTVTFPDLIGKSGLFSDGDWIESKDQEPNGDVRLIQLADIGVGNFINKSSRFMTSSKAAELRCTYLKQGDILIARMPNPIGRACIFPGTEMPCVTVVDICIVRVDQETVDSDWLVHFINSNKFQRQISNWITGTTRQRISRGNLTKVEIPLPPLEEQKRIAAILDKADAIRRKRHQAINLTDNLLRSVFLDMFGDPVTNPKGWEKQKLRDITRIQIGPFGTQLHKEDYIEGGFPLVNPKHIISGKVVPDNNLTISEQKHGELPEYHLAVGDIIMARRGEMGRCALITEREKNWLCGTGSLYIRPEKSGVFSEYLYALLSSPAIKANLESESLGATMPNLNKGIVGNIDILVPSDAILEKYSEVRAKYEILVDRSRTFSGTKLFDSLSQQAFCGELGKHTKAA